jgi:hypothetical protein
VPEADALAVQATLTALAGVRAEPATRVRPVNGGPNVEDIAAFDEAMAEEGPTIPWEQVRADLGWP